MRRTVEDNCVWALTNDAEEQKHVLANRESGDVSCFFFWDLLFFLFFAIFLGSVTHRWRACRQKKKTTVTN